MRLGMIKKKDKHYVQDTHSKVSLIGGAIRNTHSLCSLGWSWSWWLEWCVRKILLAGWWLEAGAGAV